MDMAEFLDNRDFFRGDGSLNSQGVGFEEFIESYDDSMYEHASNTVDTLVLSHEGEFGADGTVYRILLVKRGNHPCIGFWALPGGFVEMKESLEEAAKRELYEETSIRNIPVVQFGSWGNVNRDPRTRIITTAYMAVVEDGLLHERAGDDAADAAWFTVRIKRKGATVKKDGFKVTRYGIELESDEKRIRASATVDHRISVYGILKEEYFDIIESDIVAGDHSALIMKAMLLLDREYNIIDRMTY